MLKKCRAIGCLSATQDAMDFCASCESEFATTTAQDTPKKASLSTRYPQYYKAVGDFTEIDVYAVHHLFDIQDPAGCIQHASKKLLLSGVRTGGKSTYDDIREARDTLNRWLELHQE